MINYRINDCPVLAGNCEDIYQLLIETIESKHFFQPIVTLNVSMFSVYDTYPELRKWLIDHAIFTADGISISILIFKSYFCWVKQYPGIDMVHDLLQRSTGYKVAMIGASSNRLKQACDYFQLHYGHHELVFSMDGFCDFSDAHIAILKNVKPDIVLVAMGCPRQDELLQRLTKELPSGIGIGVGGVFDVWAGASRRAPLLFRRLGLEWLIRIIYQPRRIFSFVRSMVWIFK